MLLVGHGLCLDAHITVLLRDSLHFIPCWRWLTVILVTLTVKSIVTCYVSVVNFERHELSAIFRGLNPLIEPPVLTLHLLCLNPKYDLDIILIQSRVNGALCVLG
jgi:hypothetical protein